LSIWYVDSAYNLLKVSIALPIDFDKNAVTCEFDEPFWVRPPQSKITQITHEPIKALENADIPVEDESQEKTGEEPEDK
jgi:hypothetical protein